MKKLLLLATALLTSVMTMVSCNSDDYDPSSIVLVTTRGGSLDFFYESDFHKTFYVTNKAEVLGFYTPKEGQRLYIRFTENQEKYPGFDYTINLQSVLPLYTADAVEVTTKEEMDELTKNKDKIEYMDQGGSTAFLSEDFLTLSIINRTLDPKKHEYHLIIDKTAASKESGYLDMTLIHQNNGDNDGAYHSEIISFDLKYVKHLLQGMKGINLHFDSYEQGERSATIDQTKMPQEPKLVANF